MFLHQINAIPIMEEQIPVKQEWVDKIKDFEFVKIPIGNGLFTKDKYILNTMPDLKKIFEENVEKYVRDCLHISLNIKFKLQNSWINKHIRNDMSQAH